MKALTIWQPWAECIAAGAKTIENRRRPFGYRGPLAIHAGLRRDRRAERFPLVRAVVDDPDGLPAGALVAVAELVDCHPDAGCCRPWGEPGAYHLVLAHVRRLPRPIPARGQRGLWDATSVLADAGLLALPAEVGSGHTSGISDPRHQTPVKEEGTAGPAAGSVPIKEGGASMTTTCHTPHPGDGHARRLAPRLTAVPDGGPVRGREVTR